ncbi:MAG: hypothetical protein AAF203_02825, partial [Pseudomonadota bacterium]
MRFYSYRLFKKAMDNEFFLDQLAWMEQKQNIPYLIPFRTLATKSFFIQRGRVAWFIFLLIRIFWLLPILPIWFIREAFGFLNTISFSSRPNPPQGHIIVGTSVKAYDIQPAKDLVLTVPWIQPCEREEHKSLFSYLGPIAILRSFIFAYFFSFRFFFEAWGGNKVLQTYCAFQWICVAEALSAALGPDVTRISFSNHFDRYAILLSHMETHSQRVLHQHGGVFHDKEMPTKLKNISEFYYIDSPSLSY